MRNTSLELSVEVLLIATIIGREHDLCRSRRAVVGEIKEVAVVREQLALFVAAEQILPHDDQAVGLAARTGRYSISATSSDTSFKFSNWRFFTIRSLTWARLRRRFVWNLCRAGRRCD